MRRFTQYPLGLIGLGILVALVVAAIGAPHIAPQDPLAQSLSFRLRPPMRPGASGTRALLGTDQLGRDVLSRLIYGSRVSLTVAGVSVLFAGILGTTLGLLAGYYGSVADNLVMRFVDVQLAFPLILLALVIVGLFGSSLFNIVVVFVVTGWPLYARTIRGAVLSLKGTEFIEAARAVGASDSRIIVRELFPNVIGPLVVISSYEMARIVILEAALGFLGLGIQPPTPTWGNMLADGREYVQDAWWLSTFPGVMIMLSAAGINFVGDAFRDVVDPRQEIAVNN